MAKRKKVVQKKTRKRQSEIGADNRVNDGITKGKLLKEVKASLSSQAKKNISKSQNKSIKKIKSDIDNWKKLMGISSKEYKGILSSLPVENASRRKSKRKINLRNKISSLLSQYLSDSNIDLRVYDLIDNNTNEIVAKANQEDTKKAYRYNVVLSNIYSSVKNKGLDIWMISTSFDIIFKDYSGLQQVKLRDFEQFVPFYEFDKVFGVEPVYMGVDFRITVNLPDVLTDNIYRAEEDPAISSGNLMNRDEFVDWFRFSRAKQVCRDYDTFCRKKGHSEPPEFILVERKGDVFVHYNLSVSGTFEDRYEVETTQFQLPENYEYQQSQNIVLAINNELSVLRNTLEFIPNKDRPALLDYIKSLEDKVVFETQMQSVFQKSKSNEKKVVSPPSNNKEVEMKLEIELKEKDIELGKIQLEREKVEAQQKRIALIQRLLDQGMSVDDINKLLG